MAFASCMPMSLLVLFSSDSPLQFSPLLQADAGNNAIRGLDLNTGVVSTLAGGIDCGITDGVGTAATFCFPSALAVNAAGNLVLVVSVLPRR